MVIEITSWGGDHRTLKCAEPDWVIRSTWKLKSEGFWDVLRSPENFKIFHRQKIKKFRDQKFFAHFFREKNPTFFEIWKILEFSRIKKTEFFWTRISSSKNFRFFIFENSNIFQISKKCWIFFSKKVCEHFFEMFRRPQNSSKSR